MSFIMTKILQIQKILTENFITKFFIKIFYIVLVVFIIPYYGHNN